MPNINDFMGAGVDNVIDMSQLQPVDPAGTQPVTPPEDTGTIPVEPAGTFPITPPVEPTAPTQLTPDNTTVLDEGLIFTHLSEKLGREVKSFEDLKPQEAPTLDPTLKAIQDWSQRTGRPLSDWIKYQKDYSQFTDIDVVRESLRLEYPNLTDAEIQLEIETTYLAGEDDLDNEKALKNLRLKKDATKGREVLNNLKLELDTAVSPSNYPKEIQDDLNLARQVKEQYKRDSQDAQHYTNGIKTASSALEKIQINVGDLNLDYSIPADERAKLPEYVDSMPHWKNADGTPNHSAVVRDAAIIKNFDAIIKAVYEQGLSAGADKTLADASNITLQQRAAFGSAEPPKTGFTVEGYDKMIRGNVVKIGAGR